MLIYWLSPLLRFLARLASWHAYSKMNEGLKNPEYAQTEVFRKIMKNYNRSADAKRRGLIKNYDEFTERFRPINYEEGQKDFHNLTVEKVQFYEKTSGSSGDSKLIPYTKGLLRSFSSMFKIWAYDLLSFGPVLNRGRFYFSVSPQFDNDYGLEDDSEYLDSFFQWLLSPLLIADPKLKKLKKPKNFKKALALNLLAEKNLEVISIWSPSYLTVVMDYIRSEKEKLIPALKVGSVRLEGQLFTFPIADQDRIQAIQDLNWEGIFPELKLISTWGDAHALEGKKEIENHFPNVLVQSKGLLATEAPLTVPSLEHGTQIPLFDQVFFEFIPTLNPESIVRLHNLKIGQEYEVLITQKSGLYRYRLGDLVKVEKKVGLCPCFNFIGKTDNVCDLVGEKLNEEFVLRKIREFGLKGRTALVPDQSQAKYFLVSSDEEVKNIADQFDRELMHSFHYNNARKLGQLSPVEPLYIENFQDLLFQYLQEKRGMKLGDIKSKAIYKREFNGQLKQFLRNSLDS